MQTSNSTPTAQKPNRVAYLAISFVVALFTVAIGVVAFTEGSTSTNVTAAPTPPTPLYFQQQGSTLAISGGLHESESGPVPSSVKVNLTGATYTNAAAQANWSCRFMTPLGAKMPTSFYCYATNVSSFSAANVTIVNSVGDSNPALAQKGPAFSYGA